VCGYPIKSGSGDLYGGGLYQDSSTATTTPQGIAIKQAALKFGDGKTLPFAPCKRGYLPMRSVGSKGQQEQRKMVACLYHEKFRRKRLARDKGQCRKGEADPNQLFWSETKHAICTTAAATVHAKVEKSRFEKGILEKVTESKEVNAIRRGSSNQ